MPPEPNLPASPQSEGSWEDRRVHPWPGLASYEEADESSFFGRQREGVALATLVNRSPLVIVFGKSGDGKTSLLNAGLLPRLRQQNQLPISIRTGQLVGDRPPEKVIIELTQQRAREAGIECAALTEPILAGTETLWEYYHRLEFWDARNRPVTPVLIFDQFEEVFTLGRGTPQVESFLIQLADLVENRLPTGVRAHLENHNLKLPYPVDFQHYKVVLCLREDYVPRLDDLRSRMASVMGSRFVVRPLNGDQALEAVLGPGRHIVEPEVGREIVRFVAAADEGGSTTASGTERLEELSVEPALLSVVCRELNNQRLLKAQPHITTDELRQNRSTILLDLYERSFSDLDPSVRSFVEDRLITSSGNRCTLPLETATEAGLTEDIVETLIGRRMIRTEARLGIPHLELTHDLLAGMARESRNRRQLLQVDAEWEEEAKSLSRRNYRRVQRAFVLVLSLLFLGLLIPRVVPWITRWFEPAPPPAARKAVKPPRPPPVVSRIPQRDARCTPAQLDLKDYFNAALGDDWHNPAERGNNLELVPTGLATFGAVSFDVRGIIQLQSVQLRNFVPSYPEVVRGIRVHQKAARLQFLHGTGWTGQAGEVIAIYLVRYADGDIQAVSIRYGDDVLDWWYDAGNPSGGRAQPVWKGTQTRWKQSPQLGIRLFLKEWTNPRPDVSIESIDLVSAMSAPAPFVIAITVGKE